jgi:hypothetical protein
MSQHSTQLPARFRVGATYGSWKAGGTLVIAPGEVTFEFGREKRLLPLPKNPLRAVSPVTTLRARLLPPGFNSGLLLTSEDGTRVLILTWWGIRRRVRAALHEAEFGTCDVSTWFSIGTRMTRPGTAG